MWKFAEGAYKWRAQLVGNAMVRVLNILRSARPIALKQANVVCVWVPEN